MAIPKKAVLCRLWLQPLHTSEQPQGVKNALQVPRLDQCPAGNERRVLLGSRLPGAGRLCTSHLRKEEMGEEWEKTGTIPRYTILTHSFVFLSFQGEPAPRAGHQGHRGAAALQRDHGQQHEEKRQTQPGPEVREDMGASSRIS